MKKIAKCLRMKYNKENKEYKLQYCKCQVYIAKNFYNLQKTCFADAKYVIKEIAKRSRMKYNKGNKEYKYYERFIYKGLHRHTGRWNQLP